MTRGPGGRRIHGCVRAGGPPRRPRQHHRRLDRVLGHGREACGAAARRGMPAADAEPPRWHKLEELNYRGHRKILVVDGRIGFIGGTGIADQWLGHAQDNDHWRETHVRIRGPIVRALEGAFYDNLVEDDGTVTPYWTTAMKRPALRRLDAHGQRPDQRPQWPQASVLLSMAMARRRSTLRLRISSPTNPRCGRFRTRGPRATMLRMIRVRFAPSPTGYLHVGGAAHGAVQLAVRAPARRRVRPAHRRHRRRALVARDGRGHSRRPALARPRLGRRAGTSAARTRRTFSPSGSIAIAPMAARLVAGGARITATARLRS